MDANYLRELDALEEQEHYAETDLERCVLRVEIFIKENEREDKNLYQ